MYKNQHLLENYSKFVDKICAFFIQVNTSVIRDATRISPVRNALCSTDQTVRGYSWPTFVSTMFIYCFFP